MRALMIAAALAVATGTAAQAINTVEGEARVIDGDTVVVAGVTVRLKGVDAPEQADKYGPDATNGMRAIVGDWLRCELTGEKTRKREVGYCVNAAGRDIGQEIISRGLALACPFYSRRYIPFEQPGARSRLPRAPYCHEKAAAVRPSSKAAPAAPR
jgi:endonuclease YncB( thermonuclease family)